MADFKPINAMNVKMKVPMTSAGNIAQSGDTPAATKQFSLRGVAVSANLVQSNTVWTHIFSNICGGSFDSLSAEREFKGGVLS